MARLEELSFYKSHFRLWTVIRNRGGKPAALLGRDFLCAVFPQLETRFATPGTESAGAAPSSAHIPDEFPEFLRAFKLELRGLESLFWAPSFDDALRQRREARVERTQQRVNQLVEECVDGSAGGPQLY
jgi:hypothetical protein